jgi:orotate phosphoribosyltransferase
VDDVMTKGNSVIHAVEAVRNEGYATARVVLVIDREVPHNYVKDRVKCFSIFNHSDFSRFIDDKLKEVH